MCLFLLCFSACSKQTVKIDNNININEIVATKLEEMDKGYSDETLKALSVILRTNLTINNSNTSIATPKEKYLNISKTTRNQVLKNQNNNLIEISLSDNNEYTWQKTIKKSKLLEFAFKNKINLTSISEVEPIIDNGKVVGLNIGKKYFEYETLSKEFGLESNTIESIESNKKEIIIKGKNKGFYNNFDIDKSEQLSNDNHNYKQILKTFFNDLKIN